MPTAAVAASISKQALPVEETDMSGTPLGLNMGVMLGEGFTGPADATLAFLRHLASLWPA